MKTFEEVFEKLKGRTAGKIAVAAAADAQVLTAVQGAVSLGIAEAVLVGDAGKIRQIAKEEGLDISQAEIVDEPDARKAAAAAVKLVHDGKAQVLMKGLIGSADFLRAVLDKENGLRSGKPLSCVAVLKSPEMDRLILMTDGGMVMDPDLEAKVHLLENALPVCRALEIREPRAAAVCAVETVNPAMQATLDAAALTAMAKRGQIRGVIVDGPLALDNALSEEAARHKGIESPVAGKADIILAPNLEAGNMMYKTLMFMGKGQSAALIVGAAAPVIMTSRADSPETKLNSIALALLAS